MGTTLDFHLYTRGPSRNLVLKSANSDILNAGPSVTKGKLDSGLAWNHVTLPLLSTGFEWGVILGVAQRSATRTKNSSHVIFSFRPPLPQALTGRSLVYPILPDKLSGDKMPSWRRDRVDRTYTRSSKKGGPLSYSIFRSQRMGSPRTCYRNFCARCNPETLPTLTSGNVWKSAPTFGPSPSREATP